LRIELALMVASKAVIDLKKSAAATDDQYQLWRRQISGQTLQQTSPLLLLRVCDVGRWARREQLSRLQSPCTSSYPLWRELGTLWIIAMGPSTSRDYTMHTERTVSMMHCGQIWL